MERKVASIAENVNNIAADVLNPFVHKLELNTYDKLKVAVMTVTIFPIRVLLIFFFLVCAWILACVGLIGLSEEEVRKKPMTGWRRDLKKLINIFMRALFVAGGFNWITVKGKQASQKEAPVIALAPHSSYFDALPIVFLGSPSIVAKGEAEQTPFFGKLINFTQPVYVWREDPDSRQNTIKEIQRRAKSDDDWDQVVIFPEGTCSNRTSLIQFKPGAFYPGVPVQPVTIKYPNRLDTITWTWEGPGALKSMWLSLCQFHNYCEIEYLPVYVPSEEEIKNPRLFASNVRDQMAKALGVPVADYSYDDCRLMTKAGRKNLPYERGLVEVQKLREKLGVDLLSVERELNKYAAIANGKDGLITLEDFANYLGIPPSTEPLKELFSLYDTDGTGKIDFRQYLIGLSLIAKPANTEETLQIAFQLFDGHGYGHITKEDITNILKRTLNMTAQESERLFNLAAEGKGFITYNDFKSYAQKKPEYAKIFTINRLRWLNNKDQHKDEKKENNRRDGGGDSKVNNRKAKAE